MNDRINKTFICSIVFLDIINYAKKTDFEKIEVKNQFNALINNALKDIEDEGCIILDTGDGAAIACNGSPEDALFISLTIRDEILKSNIHNAKPLLVRFGINLGTVRMVHDVNGHPNVIGDGINVAQRIMSFAKPNQILVSRSYHEVTSHLSQEISQMFDYSGIKQDKHVREHEVYSVRLQKDILVSNGRTPILNSSAFSNAATGNLFKSNWKYAVLALPVIAILAGLVKISTIPKLATVTLLNAGSQINTEKENSNFGALIKPALTESNPLAGSTNTEDLLLSNKAVKGTTASQDIAEDDKKNIESSVKLKPIKQKTKAENHAETLSALPPPFVLPKKESAESPRLPEKPVVVTVRRVETHKDKSTWQNLKDSVTSGQDKKCTQAEVAMNQCH